MMGHAELYDRIIEFYEETHSVKKTAEELGTSVIKVRRVLITEGLWSSATSRKILALWEQGMSTKEIAEQLHYTEKNVQAFLPYTKGEYGRESKSSYSIRSKEYRERNQQAAQKIVGASAEKSKDFVRTEDLPKNAGANYGSRPVALKLHLELNMDCSSKRDIEVLRSYGKMNNAISRDIVVPADMTLHSLHYAMQKLFGWQNEHLHHYEFPEGVFNELTKGSFSRWCSLAGIYFRFPSEEMDDLFWDDDYEPNMSVKSWLRSKYKGPYYYGGLGDYYYENQKQVLELKRELPSFQVQPSFQEFMKNGGKSTASKPKTVSIEDATVEEFRNSIDLGGDITHLLERLTLMEYLYLPNNDYFLSSIDDQIAFLEDRLESNIKMWDSTLRGIDDQYEAFCFLAAFSTVRMQAKSNRIHYFYDYGDGWEVSVELIDAFYPDSLDEQDDSIRTAVSSHAPVCIKADGLPVLEDVGGIHGYADFLLTLHHSQDGVEREEIREWARSLGWTGRAIKPKNML